MNGFVVPVKEEFLSPFGADNEAYLILSYNLQGFPVKQLTMSVYISIAKFRQFIASVDKTKKMCDITLQS